MSGLKRKRSDEQSGEKHIQLEYVIKCKPDPEFEWIRTISVTAHLDNDALQTQTSNQPSFDTGRLAGNDEDDDEERDPWDEEFEEESEEEPECIGRLFGRLIDRNKIRDDFLNGMEEPSNGTAELGFGVFDRYGYPQLALTKGRKKGTGIWGEELGLGNLFEIDVIRVDEAYQRTGVGTALLLKAIAKVKEEDSHVRFAISWVVALNDRSITEDEEDAKRSWVQRTAVAVGLFRHNGFRRIGTTAFFALAFDTNHPSHKLALSDDLDDLDKGSELQKFEDELEEKRTVQWIMSARRVASDYFRGHKDEDVQKLLELRAMASPGPNELRAAKYGCTCGQCIRGYLSPRTQYAIHEQAELTHDSLNMTFEIDEESYKWKPDEPLQLFDLPGVQYLHSDIRHFWNTNKSVRQGFSNVYLYISKCLEKKQTVTVGRILQLAESEWPPVTRNLFQKTPTVPALAIVAQLTEIFKGAREHDLKIGDGWFEHTSPSDEEERDREEARTDVIKGLTEAEQSVSVPMDMYFKGQDLYYKRLEDGVYTEKERVNDEWAEAYYALPECRNDREYGMALGVMLQEL